jgi:methyltransferase (TIGR00027 family)
MAIAGATMKPVSKTAFYCCGVRALDAQSEKPICGDQYAQRFMDGDEHDMLELCRSMRRRTVTNVARARVIDDKLRVTLAGDPDQAIVVIGTGFDSRPYRLCGGRWYEFDEPALIEYKESKLPTSECGNRLRRIPIDFASESLELKLLELGLDEPVIVVMEGVTMYLEEDQLRSNLRAFRRAFPRHTLICDLLQQRFLRYTEPLRKTLEGFGAVWRLRSERPAEIVVSEGYRELDEIPLVDRAVELGAFWMPRLIRRTLLRDLAYGYCVHEFECP